MAFEATEKMLAGKEEYLKQFQINQKLQLNLQNKTNELSELYAENRELHAKFLQAENSAKTGEVLAETRHENDRLQTQNQGLIERISEYKEEISSLKKTIHDQSGKIESMLMSHQLAIKTIQAESERRISEKTNLIQKNCTKKC